MIRSRRQRRIDRALSAVLRTIDDDEASRLVQCVTWRDIDVLSAVMNERRTAAYDRAARLEEQWLRYVIAQDEANE
jgi:hypothetical protein